MVYGFLKKVSLHSLIYGIGNLSYVLPGFILIPLYTRYLVPAEYGAYALLTTFFGILLYVYELGMVGSMSRQFYEYDDERKRKEVVSTAFFFIILYCLALTGVLYFLRSALSSAMFGSERYAAVIAVGLFAVFFQAVIFVPMTVLRLKERPVLYVLMVSSQIILLVIFTVAFVAFLGKGLPGIYQALLLASAVSLVGYMACTAGNYKLKFSFTQLGHLLYMGLAFFPALLLAWAIEYSDRFILNIFTGLSDVGIYSLGYKVGQLPVLLVRSFNLAWVPIMFSVVKAENAPGVFAKIGTYFALGVSFTAFALSIYSREVIRVLATPEYARAYSVIFLISASYIFYGLYVFFMTGVIIKKNVYSMPLVLLAGAVTNIGLNLLLIPAYGIMGAAAATLAAYVVTAVLAYYFSQKSYRISYELGKIVKIVFSGTAVYFLSTLVKIENIFFAVAVKTLFLCAYAFILYFSGAVSRIDILKVRAIITGYRQS